jgi:hypothetical protein
VKAESEKSQPGASEVHDLCLTEEVAVGGEVHNHPESRGMSDNTERVFPYRDSFGCKFVRGGLSSHIGEGAVPPSMQSFNDGDGISKRELHARVVV